MVTRVSAAGAAPAPPAAVVSLLFCRALYYASTSVEIVLPVHRLLDEMQTQAQLAPSLDDGTIRRRIQAAAQDIGLPARGPAD